MKFTKRRFYHEPDRNYRLQAWNDLCHNGNSAHDSCHMYSCTIIYPDWAVPISLTNLAIYISLYLLGWKRGTISYLIYLLIGLVGIPVFSGFTVAQLSLPPYRRIHHRFYCHGNYCRTCNRSFPPALAPAHWYDCRNYHMLCARYSMVLL